MKKWRRGRKYKERRKNDIRRKRIYKMEKGTRVL